MYTPRHDTPEPDPTHDDADLCNWQCGCPGVVIDCIEDGVEAVQCVITFIGWLPPPGRGPTAKHIRAAERIAHGCTVMLRDRFRYPFRPNTEDHFVVGTDLLDVTAVSLTDLQQPLRALAHELHGAVRHPDIADERRVGRDILRVQFAARAYKAQVQLLDGLIGIDFGTEPLGTHRDN